MKKTDPDDDRLLVESCIRQDLAGWSLLTKKYESLIYASIENRLKKYGFTLPRQDVEEIKQDVLTLIWKGRKLENVRNRNDISYWLAIVSGNAAIEFMRNRHSKEELKMVPLTEELAEGLTREDASRESALTEHPAQNDISKRIDKSMEALPRREKLIMKLNIYHGKKYHEIAEILNIPKGTVSSYIKRAREKMRKDLRGL